MKGSVFVDLFRLHWNETAFGEKDIYFGEKGIYLEELKQFDSVEAFQIQYVFGKVKCYPEYCSRRNLIPILDQIIQKFFNLYQVARSRKLPNTWLDFSFKGIDHYAEISMHIKDCWFRVNITPQMNYDR